MVYDIKYTETNIGWFEVEADNEIDAERKFWEGVNSGAYDLLRTEIMDSDATAFEKD